MRNPTIYRKELTLLKKNAAKNFIIIIIVSLMLGIIGAASLFYAMSFDYSADIQHFNDSAAISIFNLIIIAIILLSVITYFITHKNTVLKHHTEPSFFRTFLSVIAACLCTVYGITFVNNGLPEKKEIVSLLLIVFSFLSTVWLLIDAFGISNKLQITKYLSYSVPLMLTFTLAYLYLSLQYAMNSDMKIYFLVMCTALLFSHLEHCSILFGFKVTAKKTVAFSVLSSGIGGAVSVPLTVAFLVYSKGYTHALLCTALFVVLWLLSLTNSCLILSSAKVIDPEPEETDGEESEEAIGEAEEGTIEEAEPAEEKSEEIEKAEEPEGSSEESSDPDVSESKDDASKSAFTMVSSDEIDPDDRDEFYFEDGDDEDILIPPMTFNDGN